MVMGEEVKHIVIAGGGITGLSAAYYVQNLFKEKNIPVNITLIEKSDQLGGKISTIERDGFVIEKGPDSFLARKLPIIHLTRELGLEEELVATNPKAKKTYILHNKRFHRMPPGLVLGIPTEISPFMKTGLISAKGKARAALDLLLPRRQEASDESLGHFLERRLGKEVLEHVAEPLLAGIYAGDTRALSLQATFPQFHGVEKKHRSLILGMMASKKNSPTPADGLPKVAKGSMFLTYRKGLKTLVQALEKELSSATILKNTQLEEIEKLKGTNEESSPSYQLRLSDGSILHAHSLILTLPTFASAKLLEAHLEQSVELEKVPYVSVANVIMAFDEKDINHELDGSGFLVPRKEGLFITACTWTSSKWLHTAPKGKVLLRCYVGRSGDQEHLNLSDEELIKRVRADLKELMGITKEPLFVETTRLNQSMPQYPVGHLDNIKNLRKHIQENMPGILLAGAGFHGVGIPDCVRQGKEAATEVLQQFSK